MRNRTGVRVSDTAGEEFTVLAVDDDAAWVKNGRGRCVRPLRNLTLVPDTVTVELPRDVAERWSSSTWPTQLSQQTSDACRKALGR